MTVQIMKRLAIIGGGPGGLATARVFLKNSTDYQIDLFEADATVGGLWHYPDTGRDGRPMYEHLETNITKHIMQFSGFPFPSEVPTYPWRKNVFEYLKSYYAAFIENEERVKVHLNTRVLQLSKKASMWNLTARNAEDDSLLEANFDYVVVANGHHLEPRMPDDVAGLDEWVKNGAAIPARDFENCLFARGKNVVVVGNGSSGSDILNQVSTVADKVYHSVRNVESVVSTTGYPKFEGLKTVPTIARVNWPTRTVEFSDGTQIGDIDYLIYATGYLYSLPFADSSLRAQLLGDPDRTSACRIFNLWKQIFYVRDPTLAFSLLPQLIVPFPLAELQAALMVKAFNGDLTVPPQPDDVLDPELLQKQPAYHPIPDFKDVDYYRELQAILDGAGGSNDPLQPVKWNEEYKQMRIASTGDKQKRNIILTQHASNLRAQNKPYELINFSL
ncbi:hypothetical protein HG536_0A00820 [Torulaspora globosa]|uniref:FAD/NAD(P)-binding domain-containing protein n=1 Tax=Torulaspora globosa TaxID=48254 RepID=A0A7G3Z9S9_9SACH|nr:uncharacterized protein HG536_0A00820 [Torulaspora globosa]QLL30265.1 hypothetical protein HG536_0A00820 [Torulaspora globosa]